jgi:protein transport protein SEC24
VQILCSAVKASLDRLPGDSRTRIGFLTFDSTLHFYNLKASLAAPQMLVVSDLEEPFLPLPDELLVNLSESRAVVEALLASLPAFFPAPTCLEAATGPALQAAHLLLQRLGGKLLLFQASLPSLGAGRLKTRGDDPRLYGSDREHTLRIAEDSFYKKTAAEFSRVQIGVNCYLFANSYIDVASLGEKHSGSWRGVHPTGSSPLRASLMTYRWTRAGYPRPFAMFPTFVLFQTLPLIVARPGCVRAKPHQSTCLHLRSCLPPWPSC